jgi:quinol-cytochrome oxidoreductase complex cytochrome b subunit
VFPIGKYEDGLARVIVSMGMGVVYGLFQRGREFIWVIF